MRDSLARLPRPAVSTWLRTIRIGLLLVLIGSVVRLLPFTLFSVFPRWSLRLIWWLTLAGTILATSREPSGPERSRQAMFFQIVTRALAGFLLFFGIVLTFVNRSVMAPATWAKVWMWHHYAQYALFAAGLIFLSNLSRRLGRVGLSWQCWLAIVAVPATPYVSYGLHLLTGGGFWPFFIGPPANPLYYVVAYALPVLVVGWFALILLAVFRATRSIAVVDRSLPD